MSGSGISLNVGILGHVDAGKTSLTRAIAQMASTAAFDKHAEKTGRHNTLDLGFSCLNIDNYRLALVDCPGHSTLIKAVLAASSVFDMAIMVIDASCGIQPQTAEHLLLCSIFCPEKVVILLSKIDLISKEEIVQVRKRVRKALRAVNINEDSPIVECSLLNATKESLEPLVSAIRQSLYVPQRNDSTRSIMAVDHCFSIKGKGTVMTGTMIEGSISIGQDIEIPTLREKRKIKGLESWKEPVDMVGPGERAAVLVHNLNAENISRIMISSPGALVEVSHCLVSVVPITFYRASVASGSKIHISIGFDTVLAVCCFLLPTEDGEYEQVSSLSDVATTPNVKCLLSLERAVYSLPQWFYIASKLDHQGKGCRFAFHGRIGTILSKTEEIKRFVKKVRTGNVERVETGGRSFICQGLFKKETRMDIFQGMKVVLSSGQIGRIEGSFGKGGKVRITLEKGQLNQSDEKSTQVNLHLKKYKDGHIKDYIPVDT